MAQLSLLLIYFPILFPIIINLKASLAANFIDSICSNTTKFANHSKYQTNLNTLFHYLTSNATNRYDYNATAGVGTNDVVYGHFLCRGGQSKSSCQDCVKEATTTDLPVTYCPYRKMAIIWYDECMVRYSNESFIGIHDYDTGYIQSNPQNVTGNVSQFMYITNDTLKNITSQATGDRSHYKYERSGVMVLTSEDSIPIPTKYCINNGSGVIYCGDIGPVSGPSSLPIPPPPSPISNTTETGAGTMIKSPSGSPSPAPQESNATGTATGTGTGTPILSPSSTPSRNSGNNKRLKIIVTASAVSGIAILVAIVYFLCRRKARQAGMIEGDITRESLLFSMATLETATNGFSNENKLGQGGYGSVYKGTLPNGKKVAVKRLTRSTLRGEQEFKNEILLVAKLHHKNLASLLGFALNQNEKILVYEYFPNKSLDNFVFDPVKQGQLNWRLRYNIIHGIAKGMLYLHQDSGFKIIHRDLKASNILLDTEMNPKIADFGLARMFAYDKSQSNTSRVVGTYGYMSPEYAMHGIYSAKSDVYSYGILILEIINGKINSGFPEGSGGESLVIYARKLWQEGKSLEFVDQSIRDSCSIHEVTRCVHLGLLCVQKVVEARPTMATMVLILESNNATLPVPGQPGFFDKLIGVSEIHNQMVIVHSSNDDSLSEIEPR